MRVSIDAAPWRRFIHAARWNGQPAHSTTGPAMAKVSHCQLVNCRVLIIDSSSTGTPRTMAPISRWRSARTFGSSSGVSSGAVPVGCRSRDRCRVADVFDLGDEVVDAQAIGDR